MAEGVWLNLQCTLISFTKALLFFIIKKYITLLKRMYMNSDLHRVELTNLTFDEYSTFIGSMTALMSVQLCTYDAD